MKTIGRYEVRGEIARGGMGVVYRAWDPLTQREVAIKLLLNLATETQHTRFMREARALARVVHPNVVRLLDYAQTERGQPYLVLELVEGESLQRRIDRAGPLPPDEALAIASTLCEAVAACHAAGVLHRDLKPENVVATREGALTLIDFGLVRDTDPSLSRTQVTAEGRFLGSPGYWAPEQATGDLQAISARTDVYGLGGTLFALLTGDPPQRGQTLPQLLDAATRPKPAPSSLNPRVPPWLDRVVAQALALDPAERFASAGELGAALASGAGLTSYAPVWVALGLVSAGLLAASAVLTLVPASSTVSTPPPLAGEAVSAPAPTSTIDRAHLEEVQEIYERGVAKAAAGDLRDAIADFDEALGRSPGHLLAWRERSQAKATLGDHRGLIADAELALQRDPSFALAWTARGVGKLKLGDHQAAIEDFSQALRLDPGHTAAWNNRANVRLTLRDNAGALEDSNAALRLEPALASAWLHRSTAKLNLGDYPGAIADASEALRLDPSLVSAWCTRSAAWVELGDATRAHEDAAEAIRRNPTFSRGWACRSAARAGLGDYTGALEDADEAIRIDPTDMQVWCNRSLARGALGDVQGAIDDASEAIRLAPGDPSPYINRAAAKGAAGDGLGAIADLDEAIRLGSSDSLCWVNRGVAKQGLGDRRGAIQDFEHALRIEPDGFWVPSVRQYLADLRAALDQE